MPRARKNVESARWRRSESRMQLTVYVAEQGQRIGAEFAGAVDIYVEGDGDAALVACTHVVDHGLALEARFGEWGRNAAVDPFRIVETHPAMRLHVIDGIAAGWDGHEIIGLSAFVVLVEE